jgi:hypothetical protein
VSTLLERCVRSIINQTSEKFKLIIVCHERPEIKIDHSAINYVEVDFYPPELGQANVISQMDRDKNKKMWLGLEYAGQFNPSHVMFVDADDSVSCHLAEFVSQSPQSNGWYLDSGYVYEDGKARIFHKKKNFYLMSGTSHIIKYSLIRDESMSSVYVDSGEPLHQLIVNILAERQTPLEPLPFAGAVYIIQTGENINADKNSDRSGRKKAKFTAFKNFILNYPRKLRILIGSQSLNESVIHEFCLANPDPGFCITQPSNTS